MSYLPTPLVLLTDKFGFQTVHIAPEAFTVASAEFPDEIQTWQNALPGALKGKLASVRPCEVLHCHHARLMLVCYSSRVRRFLPSTVLTLLLP